MYDSTRHTPFIKAAEMGNMDHVRIFMMGNDFDIDLYSRNGRGFSGYTALLSCVQHGNYDMVYFLLQKRQKLLNKSV